VTGSLWFSHASPPADRSRHRPERVSAEQEGDHLRWLLRDQLVVHDPSDLQLGITLG
jgi:hypothetical protein